MGKKKIDGDLQVKTELELRSKQNDYYGAIGGDVYGTPILTLHADDYVQVTCGSDGIDINSDGAINIVTSSGEGTGIYVTADGNLNLASIDGEVTIEGKARIDGDKVTIPTRGMYNSEIKTYIRKSYFSATAADKLNVKLATLPATGSEDNGGHVHIVGMIGGWGASEKTQFDLTVASRGGCVGRGWYIGNMNNWNSKCDIKLITNGDHFEIWFCGYSGQYWSVCLEITASGICDAFNSATTENLPGTVNWTYLSSFGMKNLTNLA